MKAFALRGKNSFRGLASSFSWTEKRSREGGTRRAQQQADVLTFGFQTSLPPSRLRLAEPVALGDCNPSQWRNRPRISRGSQRWLRWDGKAIPELSKNGAWINPRGRRRQELSKKTSEMSWIKGDGGNVFGETPKAAGEDDRAPPEAEIGLWAARGGRWGRKASPTFATGK